METTKNRTALVRKVLRMVYIGLLLFHLLLWAMNVRGQTFLQATTFQRKHPMIESKQAAVRNIYTSQLGVREKQNNSGLEVEKYLRYVHLPKGNPWCAAFVCWVFGEAGVANPRTGWSPGLFGTRYVIWGGEPGTKGQEPGTKSQEQRLPTYVPSAYASSLTTNNQQQTNPQSGDIFGLYFPEKGRIAHVGFIDEWNEPWVITVEGNTNVLGSREGDGVYRKRRLTRSVYKVARYVN